MTDSKKTAATLACPTGQDPYFYGVDKVNVEVTMRSRLDATCSISRCLSCQEIFWHFGRFAAPPPDHAYRVKMATAFVDVCRYRCTWIQQRYRLHLSIFFSGSGYISGSGFPFHLGQNMGNRRIVILKWSCLRKKVP